MPNNCRKRTPSREKGDERGRELSAVSYFKVNSFFKIKRKELGSRLDIKKKQRGG